MGQPANIDVAVVGGGVVGLAAACTVAGRGRGTCVLERLPRFGLEASTHNSGVIHASLHCLAGSLKATLCVERRERLYAFCAAQGVPAERCGKLHTSRRWPRSGRRRPASSRRSAVPGARVAGERDVALLPGSGVEAATVMTPSRYGRRARRSARGPVYPLPFPSGHGLGVHVTRTTWGSVTLGPTATRRGRKTTNRTATTSFTSTLPPRSSTACCTSGHVLDIKGRSYGLRELERTVRERW